MSVTLRICVLNFLNLAKALGGGSGFRAEYSITGLNTITAVAGHVCRVMATITGLNMSRNGGNFDMGVSA